MYTAVLSAGRHVTAPASAEPTLPGSTKLLTGGQMSSLTCPDKHPPSRESQDSFIRRESRCSTQCKVPLQNISAAALSHATENCDEDAEAVHLPVRLLFLLQGNEQFLTHTHTECTPPHTPPPAITREHAFSKHFSRFRLVDLGHTAILYLAGREDSRIATMPASSPQPEQERLDDECWNTCSLVLKAFLGIRRPAEESLEGNKG